MSSVVFPVAKLREAQRRHGGTASGRGAPPRQPSSQRGATNRGHLSLRIISSFAEAGFGEVEFH